MPMPHSSDLLSRFLPGRKATDADLLEQYKLAVGSWNQEMQRFWFRFNILVGLELAALIGLVAKYDDITKHPFIFGLLLTVMACYSLLTLGIVRHGINVYNNIVSVLTTIEQRSDDKLFLIRVFLAQRLPMKDPQGMWYAVGIQAALTFVWWIVAGYEIYKMIW